MKRPDLSIILATYNERGNIPNIIRDIHKVCKQSGIKEEIIVMDDNSPDKTANVVRKLMRTNKFVKLVVRPKKVGLGAAIYDGYKRATGKYIMSMDADYAHNPKYIPKFYKKLQQGYDVATASRSLPGGKDPINTGAKVYVHKISVILSNLLLGMRLTDYTNNMRMFKREILPKDIKSKSHMFLTEFLYKTHKKGAKIVEVPVVLGHRPAGKSKLNLRKEAVRGFFDLIKIRFDL